MDYKLSEYQENIINQLNTNNQNLLIDAKAGSGKTSTLLIIANELIKNNKSCLFLAFNKNIVEELQNKMPILKDYIKTVHSLGRSFISSYLYRKHNTNYNLEIENDKVKILCEAYYETHFKNIIENYCSNEENKNNKDILDIHRHLVNDFVSLCNYTRLYSISDNDIQGINNIIDKFCDSIDDYIKIIPNYYDLVITVKNKILEMFENPDRDNSGIPTYYIDFLDMIYLPVYYDMQIPAKLRNSLDTILVDEAQDLSILQQLFIKKLNNGFNRFIFVGDRNQSIYRI